MGYNNGNKRFSNNRKKYEDTNNQFINPYNFVTVNWKQINKKDFCDNKNEKLYSGVLHCHIYSRTPISIPDYSSKYVDEIGHQKYTIITDENGEPMIPGSSLRGVIRSVYETVTDSCFSTNLNNEIITRRSGPREFLSPGILVKENDGNWTLYKADKYSIQMRDKEYYGGKKEPLIGYTRKELLEIGFARKVYFKEKGNKVINNSIKTIKFDDAKEGYLFIGEPGCKKNHEFIFSKKEEYDKVTSDIVNTIKEIVKIYNDPSVNKNVEGGKGIYEGYKNINQMKEIPIWYNVVDNRIVVSVASLGRVSYNKTMGELLQKKKRCNNRKSLCDACNLFGMVGEKDNSIGSRIRITDAVAEKNNSIKLIKDVTLKELSGPKKSYIPFYAIADGQISSWDYDNASIMLRGRKYYWHNMQEGHYKTKEKNKRNETMDLIDLDNRLYFDVFYDGITKNELETLKWVITIGENDEQSNYCYKIGHGKPIGLGSAKLIIDSEWKKSFAKDYELLETELSIPETLEIDRTAIQELKHIMDVNATKGFVIRYPYIEDQINNKDNNRASHKWFTDNWQKGKMVKTTLPTILNTPAVKLNSKRYIGK